MLLDSKLTSDHPVLVEVKKGMLHTGSCWHVLLKNPCLTNQDIQIKWKLLFNSLLDLNFRRHFITIFLILTIIANQKSNIIITCVQCKRIIEFSIY
jgi:hypothetical protein